LHKKVCSEEESLEEEEGHPKEEDAHQEEAEEGYNQPTYYSSTVVSSIRRLVYED
jgi:hypothetical protein